MSLAKSLLSLKLDSRMLEYNFKNGLITKEEYEAYLKQLPDLSNNLEFLSLEDKSDNMESQLQH